MTKASSSFPSQKTLTLKKAFDLRYGENPHQSGAVYFEEGAASPLKKLKLLAGRTPSLVNVSDINAGLSVVRMFSEPAAVVIKHNTPCGIALGKSSDQALMRAIEADAESAFGGIIVVNTQIDMKTAKVISSFKDEKRGNIDVVAGVDVEKNALELLKQTRKSMAVYKFGEIKSEKKGFDYKRIDGGFIIQENDYDIEKSFADWKVVTKKKPTAVQLSQMKLAWKFISRIRSNAVIIVDGKLPMTRGIGTGQTSRVRSTGIALEQAGENVRGAILASDSFFPFDDSVKKAAKYGIGAIIQQGQSINDQASIDAADVLGIPMVFTYRRAFWH